MTLSMSWLILWIMFLLSLSSPASMHALSNTCLTIRLASSGEFFLYSFSSTISWFSLSNQKVMSLSSARGLPALACSSMRLRMKAIWRMPEVMGEMTSAGPSRSLEETTTLVTQGCSSFLIQREKAVRSSAGTACASFFFSSLPSLSCSFTPFSTRSTSAVAFSTLANLSPSQVSIQWKMNSSTGVLVSSTGMLFLVRGQMQGLSVAMALLAAVAQKMTSCVLRFLATQSLRLKQPSSVLSSYLLRSTMSFLNSGSRLPSLTKMAKVLNHFTYSSGFFSASSLMSLMTRLVRKLRSLAMRALSWKVSLEMLRGMSSQSTTPFTKRRKRGSSTSLQSFLISTLREYRLTSPFSCSIPQRSEWFLGMQRTVLRLRGTSEEKCSLYWQVSPPLVRNQKKRWCSSSLTSFLGRVQMGLTRLTASPLMAMGKLMKLEYFCTICWISVFSTNFRCDSLMCSTILVPLASPSSSTYSTSYVPLPSDVHLWATPPASREVTSTRSLTMKAEQKPTPNWPMMFSLASAVPGSALPSSPCTNSLEPERAMVPSRSMSACRLMPMPLSWMTSCPFAGNSSTLMVSSWLDCSLNLCFSRASEAFDSSYRTNTYASVYSDLATMSSSRLVSALNQRRSLLEEKAARGVRRSAGEAEERVEGRQWRAERSRAASRRRFAFNIVDYSQNQNQVHFQNLPRGHSIYLWTYAREGWDG